MENISYLCSGIFINKGCRKMRIKLIVIFLLTTFTGACSPRQAPVAALADPLVPQRGQVWQLVAQQGKRLALNKKAPTLLLDPEAGIATGDAQCNTYTFHCHLLLVSQMPDGDHYTLALEPWGSGDTSCPEADMNAEQRYLALLAKTTSMRLTATTLTLYQKDREILHFEQQ